MSLPPTWAEKIEHPIVNFEDPRDSIVNNKDGVPVESPRTGATSTGADHPGGRERHFATTVVWSRTLRGAPATTEMTRDGASPLAPRGGRLVKHNTVGSTASLHEYGTREGEDDVYASAASGLGGEGTRPVAPVAIKYRQCPGMVEYCRQLCPCCLCCCGSACCTAE
jgi:hypothetical protein